MKGSQSNKLMESRSCKYTASTNAEITYLHSCICNSYVRHEVPCKYLYLVARICKGMKICYHGDVAASQVSASSGIGGCDGNNSDNGDSDSTIMSYPTG